MAKGERREREVDVGHVGVERQQDGEPLEPARLGERGAEADGRGEAAAQVKQRADEPQREDDGARRGGWLDEEEQEARLEQREHRARTRVREGHPRVDAAARGSSGGGEEVGGVAEHAEQHAEAEELNLRHARRRLQCEWLGGERGGLQRREQKITQPLQEGWGAEGWDRVASRGARHGVRNVPRRR